MTSLTLPDLGPPRTATGPMPRQQELPLGEQLIQAGLITEDQLNTALGRQKDNKSRLGELLVELGFVDATQILPFLARD